MDENAIKLFGSKQTDHWQTPPEFLSELDKDFHFDYDPCPRYPTEDGLSAAWYGHVFVNPPYSHIAKWFKKAHEEIQKEASIIVFLVFANTDTRWFHRYCYDQYSYCTVEIRFIKGRLKFIGDSGVKNSAMRPSMLVIFRKS